MKNKRVANDTYQEIINSTLSAMAEDGIANLTTKSISKRADVSTASIHYFFATKDNLIYNSFVFVIKSIRLDMLTARKGQADPIKRIKGAMETHFSAMHLSDEAAYIWPQLWVHAGCDERTAKLVRVFGARMISNFTYDLCEAGMGRREARLTAIELRALVVGLWLEKKVTKYAAPQEYREVLDSVFSRLVEQTKGNRK
jgi:TetR/AcrR family transcriptional regulator, transcriptional repressor of bet genes